MGWNQPSVREGGSVFFIFHFLLFLPFIRIGARWDYSLGMGAGVNIHSVVSLLFMHETYNLAISRETVLWTISTGLFQS